MSRDTVKNWEAGRTEPGILYGPRIVDFLGYFPLAWPPDFPSRLTQLRWRLGLTQAALAKRLGVDESSVASWERGAHRPIRRYRERVDALLRERIRTADEPNSSPP